MRALAWTILTMGIVLAAGDARAQTYDPGHPVCMHLWPFEGGDYYDCTFQTMGQCAASASARPAQCAPNPYYVGAIARVFAREPRRAYRDRYRQSAF